MINQPDTNNKSKLLLVDGHNFLFRYFWGMPRTIISKDGKLIHGAYGFIAAILQHIKRFEPTWVIVCFDSQFQSPRAEILESYKSNRIQAFAPDSVDNPFSQIDYVRDSLNFLGLPWVEEPAIEADDLIGSYAQLAEKRNSSVVIASSDQDFLQLLSSNVKLYVRRGKKETIHTPESLKEWLKISPDQFVDFRALTGDPSDNISGIPGIGPKTASELLLRFENIENIYKNILNLRPALTEKLEQYRERVLLNKQIISINTNLPVDDSFLSAPISDHSFKMSVRQIFTNVGLFNNPTQ